MTDFEQLLQTHFPEIFDLHQASKTDKNNWLAINSILEMRESKGYGEVTIKFSDGKIDRIQSSRLLTAGIAHLPFKPDTVE